VGPTRPDLISFLRRAARIAGSRSAIAYPGGDISYTALLGRVASLAAQLPHCEQGEAIGVVTEHDPLTPEMYLGVIASGNAVVPLSNRLADTAIAHVAQVAGIRLILVAPGDASRIPGIASACDGCSVRCYGDDLSSARIPAQPGPVPDGAAMVCFTSGTTGEPKGVVLTHDNLLMHGLTAAHTYRLEARNVSINAMPLAHFAGASRVVLGIVNAGTHVILPRFEPAGLLQAIEMYAGTHTMVVPTMAADLLEVEPEKYDLSRLTLIYGTASIPMHIAEQLVHRLGCNLINGYGLTESSALATALGPQGHCDAVARQDLELLQSVGQPVPGMELKIVDEHGREVTDGSPGQIALRGAKVSPGYLNNPEQTAARFVDGWLLSGDRGRMISDGNLILLGRLDDMIITGGMNVQPEEIERELHAFEGVAECAVFPVASTRWGQEVRLALVPQPEAHVDAQLLRDYLKTRLDRYKVPKQVHLVEQLPKTSVGKVQRRRLTEQFSQGQDAGAKP
jgi:long-chain acyl-CoA synthetase